VSYDLQAEGDNGVENSTRIAFLPGFHDGRASATGYRPHDPGFATAFRVEPGGTIADSIVAIRGIGLDSSPGVVGDGGSGNGPGVLGFGGGDKGPGVVGMSAQVPDATGFLIGNGVGVFGIAAKANSHGVYGVSPDGNGVSGESSQGIGVYGTSEDGTAISGLATANGTGVVGRADTGVGAAGLADRNRGGVFGAGGTADPGFDETLAHPRSSVIPQIRLIPAAQNDLPKDALPGDLIVGRFQTENEIGLWLCVQGSGSGPAQWRPVTLGASVAGTA
jgi:hypothetical protein